MSTQTAAVFMESASEMHDTKTYFLREKDQKTY